VGVVKKVVNFLRKESAPRENGSYAYVARSFFTFSTSSNVTISWRIKIHQRCNIRVHCVTVGRVRRQAISSHSELMALMRK